jgi:phosphoribosylformylglycinamidine synthase PurS subunit
MKFEIIVQLKQNVFNAEEKEILSVLNTSGYNVHNVKIAKLFTVEIPSTSTNSEEDVRKIASTLTNAVIETFSIKKIND